jgi:uncharacterized membrane protein YozB (DUF420 family)
MDQAAIDAMAYWTAAFWLMGFAVGIIISLLLPRS